jgi:hypothetical protein
MPLDHSTISNLPLLLVLFLSGLSACSNDGTPSAHSVWDSAGVQIVAHSAVTDFGGPVYGVEYLLRISSTLPDGAGEFGKVADVDLLPDGSLAVLDEISADVRVFSPSGVLIRRIGRRGQGPGELSGVWTLGILPLPSGGLALPDVVNQAIVVFDSAGDHKQNIPWDVMQETIPQWRNLAGDTVLTQVTEAPVEYLRETHTGWWLA